MSPKRHLPSNKPAVNLKQELVAVEELLRNQRWKENPEFEYALVTTNDIGQIKDIDNEFEREAAFQEQAKSAAKDILSKCKTLGIPSLVPDTYRGEKLKDEKHMAKVCDTLRAKKDTLEKTKRLKQLREAKKIGKKVQHEVMVKRAKEKRDFLEKVKKKPVSELFDD